VCKGETLVAACRSVQQLRRRWMAVCFEVVVVQEWVYVMWWDTRKWAGDSETVSDGDAGGVQSWWMCICG
jgi:hypothetical protein